MLACLSLLLAVTTIAQDSVAPAAPRARKPRRAPIVSVAPMTIEPMMIAPMIMEAMPAIEAMPTIAPMAMEAIGPMAAIAHVFDDASWDDQDDVDSQEPGDSLYQVGRRALNSNRYQEAATTFGQVASRYPRSARAPEAMYWQAFAFYRTGDTKNLQTAVGVLDRRRKAYPNASQRDAANLAARIDGVLAQRGDEAAARRNQARADSASRTSKAGRDRDNDGDAPPGCEGYGDDDPRMIALNALLQMNAESAIPILRDVLKRRDPCSEIMRRKAVFIVSQKRTDETSRILLDAARNDPDREVRSQAIFWLSQVPGEETVIALDSILQDPKSDPEIQEKAIFALSQHRSPRATAILCTYAGRSDRPADLREKSIFWLGQRRADENQLCLRDLYKKLENDDLKEKVIFSLSQMGGADNYRWLMDIALNERENIELRKKALFWAGQGHSVDVDDLIKLYDSMKDREMREQLIFVYSQRREEATVDKLCQIGKTDPDRELRKKAIFWLGQTRSPRAGQCLQELINQ
jgi:HEAT repeat protein